MASSQVLLILCLTLATIAKCVANSEPSPPKVKGDPVGSVQGLIQRLLGSKFVDAFKYEVIQDQGGHDVFEVDSDPESSRPVLRGNTGVALASALNWYLKYTCFCSVSWGRNGSGNQLSVPYPPRMPSSKTVMVSPVKYKYYMNVCTVSYSMVWWDWERWEFELDWMALNGINLPLSFTGQEYVWMEFYRSVGLSDPDILDFLSGPAFMAWQRMGNIRRWGGPLDMQWMKDQYELQLKILQRSREYGMSNVLPGFSGHVPAAIAQKYPSHKFIRSSEWGSFNSTFSEDYLLEPTDPLFVQLAEEFYKMLIKEFGTDHFFNADTYNEMTPSSSDPTFLADTNKAIYTGMVNVDPDAVFVMQGWLFLDTKFWTDAAIEAFLSQVPDDHMLILDLDSVTRPIWSRTKSYYGKPFIWCLLHNFGGMRSMYGNLPGITQDPPKSLATPNNTMVGIGLTPEAIEQNPIVYDLMCEMGWRKEAVNLENWVTQYWKRRYHSASPTMGDAWQHLTTAVYQANFDVGMKSLIERAPEFQMYSSRSTDATSTVAAWRLMYMSTFILPHINVHSSTFHYDLVDLGHLCLSNLFMELHTMMGLAYNLWLVDKNPALYETVAGLGSNMLGIISNLDELLSSDQNYLLGTWIKEARDSVSDGSSKNLYEFNARNQITLWGYHEGIDNDYAAKAWGGLVKDYYYPRWLLFIGTVLESVNNGTPVNMDAYRKARGDFEEKWNAEVSSYPVAPTGSTVNITANLVKSFAIVSTKNYQEMTNHDIPSGPSDLYGAGNKPWTQDPDQLRFLCDVNPTCVGYTSEGFLKNSTMGLTEKPNVTVYLKMKMDD